MNLLPLKRFLCSHAKPALLFFVPEIWLLFLFVGRDYPSEIIVIYSTVFPQNDGPTIDVLLFIKCGASEEAVSFEIFKLLSFKLFILFLFQ